MRGTRVVLGDEAKRIGVDRAGGQIYVFNPVFAGEHLRELLFLACPQFMQTLILLTLAELHHL